MTVLGGSLWRNLVNGVQADRLMEDVRAIASWIRLSGSEEERQAFKYIEERLQAAGVATARHDHDALISLPGSAELRLQGPAGEPLPCITHSFAAPTGPGGLTAEVVDAGAGGPGDFAHVDMKGRLVVLDGLAMPARVQAIQQRGGAGAVFLNADPHVHEMIVSTVWGSPGVAQQASLPRIPVVSLARDDGRRLREALSRGIHSLYLRTEVDTGWRTIPLLTADIPGEAEDTFVLFAGHVDSWYYGAMDNASANAVMLEIARILAGQRLYRGLRLAFWSGHSHGRYAGSAWYADRYFAELDRRCVAHVYIDSVGGRGADSLRDGYAMPETWAVAAEAVASLTRQDFRGSPVGRSGDQSFLGLGVPSLLMTLSEHPVNGPEASLDFSLGTGEGTGGLGWWWHTPEDTVDKIDPEALHRDACVYLACVASLCLSPALPLDYGRAAADLAGLIRRRSEEAVAAGLGVDLSACVDTAEALAEECGRLEILRRQVAAGDPRIPLLNQALQRLSRLLVPLRYARGGRFDHDPATALTPLPSLALPAEAEVLRRNPDLARSAEIDLRRGANRTLDALLEALEHVRGVLSQAG